MILVELIFWSSLLAIFYAYIGYPCLLGILSFIKDDPVIRKNIFPSVSLVISAYNEEKVIERKIKNSLELDYPDDLLEIAVISDGSIDRTNDIIIKYANENEWITPFILSSNVGKTMGLNHCIPQLRGDIIIFSDANSFYEKDLIKKIVKPFADDRIGFVTGTTAYLTHKDGQIVHAKNYYSQLEYIIKKLESRLNSCVGADGAVFAIRRALYSPLKKEDINDFVIPLMIIKQRYRGIMEPDVVCEEQTLSTTTGEFKRQVRITNRTLRALFQYRSLLNPFHSGLFAFELFSHKFLKYLVPFLLIFAFLSNAVLAFHHSFYLAFIIVQLMGYGLAYADYVYQKTTSRSFFPIVSLFVILNLALLKGWYTYFKGLTYVSWSPER